MLRPGTGPLVDRPMKQFSSLIIRCRTCEKETRWLSRQLLDLGIWETGAIGSLEGKMVCSECANSGRPAREVDVRPWPPIHPGFQQYGEPTPLGSCRTASGDPRPRED